jgi:hypothetical protein
VELSLKVCIITGKVFIRGHFQVRWFFNINVSNRIIKTYRKISKYQGNCFKFSKIILVEKIVKRKRYSYRISLTMVYFHIYANQNMFPILNVNRPYEDKTTKLFHCVHKRFAIFCLKKINGNKIGLLFFHSVVRPI